MNKKPWPVVVLAFALLAAPLVGQAQRIDEEPSAPEMAADLLVARPIGVGLFALGSVTYVVTLPFSLLGGNAGEAADSLVLEPAREVFVRCLGCTRPGRKERIRD